MLKSGFAPVYIEVNNLIRDRLVRVKDEIFEIKIVFGGDYKVMYSVEYNYNVQ